MGIKAAGSYAHRYLVRRSEARYTQTDSTLLGYGWTYTARANSTLEASTLWTPVLYTASMTGRSSEKGRCRGNPEIWKMRR